MPAVMLARLGLSFIGGTGIDGTLFFIQDGQVAVGIAVALIVVAFTWEKLPILPKGKGYSDAAVQRKLNNAKEVIAELNELIREHKQLNKTEKE